jgi:uncharacterized 2Fe-2S/4Fe-4S cluster protein (DUF4445 family)
VLSSGLYRSPRLELFMDVGTNGEIVLGNSEWMMADACSAGPAFEGAGVSCGMRAMRGAIEDVNINAQTLEPTVQVIGQTAPRGICGSGMIAALAEMFLTGIVTRSGRIDAEHVNAKMGARSRIREGEHGWEYVLARAGEHGSPRDISLTDVDINNLIRTKAAIYAGIAIMASRTGVDLRDLAGVLIGGAFGQHINLEQAIVVGLLPDLPWERFHYLGNTSALGAYTTLLSRSARAKADEIARSITYLELVADSSFMNEFTSALFLPHTNIDLFPSVKALLERQEAVRTAG